jgi:ubiquitin-conjugating enzyme E2 J2
VTGPRGSPYEGGKYHGKLIFPAAYPYKPPSIMMITPSGRFKTNTRLCLSMSDFHPETWYITSTISFMLENARTYGSIESDDDTRRKLAAESLAFNVRDAQFNTLFPHYRQALEQHATKLLEEKKGITTPMIQF